MMKRIVARYSAKLLMAALLISLSLPASAIAESKRSKVIDFEDETIEGLNKRPLDSVSQLSEKEKKRRKIHLYRKRVGFSSETAQTIRTLRQVQ